MANPPLGYVLYCLFVLAVSVLGQNSSVGAPLHAELTLNYYNKEAAERAQSSLLDIQSNISQADQLRSISITGRGLLANISLLNDVLHRLPNSLTDFHYGLNIPLPLDTIKIVEVSHPACRIHYNIPFQYWIPFDDSVLSWGIGTEKMEKQLHKLRKHIIGSPNLYSLKAHIIYGPHDNYYDLALVHDILTECPNIRELDLSITRSGCILANYPYAFDFKRNGKPLAPLELLKLSRYSLDDPPDGKYSRKWSMAPSKLLENFKEAPSLLNNVLDDLKESLGMDISQESQRDEARAQRTRRRDNLDEWLDRMSWNRLRSLEIDLNHAEPDILERLGPQLESLEEFVGNFGSQSVAAAYPRFFSHLNKTLNRVTLFNLRATNYTDIVAALSASNLTSLTLAENETTRQYCEGENCSTPALLTESQLHKLSQDHASLSNLSFTVARRASHLTDRSTWSIDHTAIRAAALLPNLTNLNLYVESSDSFYLRSGGYRRWDGEYDGKRDETQFFYSDPSFNRSSTPSLFRDLNELRISQDLRTLSKLDITVGLWDFQREDFDILGWPTRLISRWICERDPTKDQDVCFGGNVRMGDGAAIPPDEPYSENWDRPDPIREVTQLGVEHEEL